MHSQTFLLESLNYQVIQLPTTQWTEPLQDSMPEHSLQLTRGIACCNSFNPYHSTAAGTFQAVHQGTCGPISLAPSLQEKLACTINGWIIEVHYEMSSTKCVSKCMSKNMYPIKLGDCPHWLQRKMLEHNCGHIGHVKIMWMWELCRCNHKMKILERMSEELGFGGALYKEKHWQRLKLQ